MKAVIFDWAGTTVDFGSMAPVAVFVEVFARWGMALSPARAREPMGLAKRDHVAALLAMPEVATAFSRAHGRTPAAPDVEALYQEVVPLTLVRLPRYAAPIPGVSEICEAIRSQGIRIGTTTGYTREMLDVLAEAAAALGFRPDVSVASDDVPVGRPAPFMCWEAAKRLSAWPASACVKVGDTVTDVLEGLNAGMWSVGVAATGNEVGLGPEEFAALSESERRRKVDAAAQRLRDAGAHAVIDSVADLLPCLAALDRSPPRTPLA